MRSRLMEVPEAAEPEIEERAPLGLGVPAGGVRDQAESALGSLFVLTLKTLSQKTIVALMALADLLLIGTAFVLWYRVMDAPSPLQLIGLGGYSLFILAAVWARRR